MYQHECGQRRVSQHKQTFRGSIKDLGSVSQVRSVTNYRQRRQTFSNSGFALDFLPNNNNFGSQSFQSSPRSTPRTTIFRGRFSDLIRNASRIVVRTSSNRNLQNKNLTQSRSIISPIINNGQISSSNQNPFFIQNPTTSFQVGDSEEELKETFLATGIFQRKPGDSLDGRRSFRGQSLSKRSASPRVNNYNKNMIDESMQSCVSVPTQNCITIPKKKCYNNNNNNCRKIPRNVCRSVPRQVCMSVPRQNCNNIPRQVCASVPRTSCNSVPRQECQDVPRMKCRKETKQKCEMRPQQKCRKIPQQKCSYEPRKSCKNSPRRVCKNNPRKVCQNEVTESCRKVPKTVCESHPTKKCKTFCRNIFWCRICQKKSYHHF